MGRPVARPERSPRGRSVPARPALRPSRGSTACGSGVLTAGVLVAALVVGGLGGVAGAAGFVALDYLHGGRRHHRGVVPVG